MKILLPWEECYNPFFDHYLVRREYKTKEIICYISSYNRSNNIWRIWAIPTIEIAFSKLEAQKLADNRLVADSWKLLNDDIKILL